MKKFFMKMFLGVYLLIIFSVSSVQSQQREQLFPGARPFGMGEAFVAIADDGNAIFWNPAGLPYLKREEVNFMYSDLYGININNFYVSYTRPIIKKLAFGIDWLNYGYDDEELSFGRNYWNLSSGYALNNYLAVGGNFKYIKTNTQLKGTSIWDADASGWGVDFGILFNYQFKNPKFLKEFRAGFMLHDAFETHLRFNSGTKEKIHARSPRFGFCYKPFDVLSWKGLSLYDPIIAMDFDDRFHLGSEVWFLKDILPVALRGGIQKDFYNDEGLIWSGGFSIQKGMFQIDYSYTMPPTLPSTHRFTIAMIWNYNPFKVEIADINIKPVFSALKYHYDENPIGEVVLKSDHHDSIKARTSFEIEGYTQTVAYSDTIILSPNGVPKPVPIKAIFGSKILTRKERLSKLKGKIKVSYQVDNTWYPDREQENVAVDLFGYNLIQWNIPERAAAFVTKDDPRVASFSNQYQGLFHTIQYPREITDAISIYEALREYHVKYRYDTTPIPGFDRVKWPAAILLHQETERGGDCEDLSALYTSLLENAGIYTALLKSERHVFLMFNTGIPVTHRFILPLPDSLFVRYRGYLWVPVDPTNIEKLDLLPFYEAWQKGVLHYHRYEGDSTFYTIFINEEHRPEKYPSIEIAPVDGNLVDSPNREIVKSMIHENISTIDNWTVAFFNKLKAKNNKRTLNQLGCIHAGFSKLDSAKNYFERALKMDSLYFPSFNNMANIYFIRHDYDTAHQYYQACLKEDKLNTGTFFNLALLYLAAKDQNVALKGVTNIDIELERVSENLVEHFLKYEENPFTKMLSIMGLFKIETEHTTAGEKLTKDQKPKKKEKGILERLINKLGDKLVDKSPKSKEKKDAAQTGIEYQEELRFMLYWEYEEDH